MDSSEENLKIAKYLVNLKLLNSGEESLVEECLNGLNEDEIWVKTVKLQVFWMKKYRPKNEVKKSHHERIYNNSLPILMEIIEGSHAKVVDKENLYRKIVIFIIMFAGLGNPTHQTIIKETHAALYSIFKNAELNGFLVLSKSLKEEQLIEFARIVTGIRLFNKDCKKGGEGIEDLPLILKQSVKAIEDRIFQFKSKIDERINHLINVFYLIYGSGETFGNFERVKFSGNEIEQLKRLLIYFRTIKFCLKDLIKDLNDSTSKVEKLVEKFQCILLRIHEILRYRIAIASAQVFPFFLQLSDVWKEFQEEVDVLSEINNNFVEMSSLAKIPNPCLVEKGFRSTGDLIFKFKPDGTLLNAAEFQNELRVCLFSAIPSKDILQFGGFCAWTLVQTGGILVTGDVTLGLLSYKNGFYSFFSTEAARNWAENPKKNITAVFHIARIKPELIVLLNLAEDLRALWSNKKESDICLKESKKTLSVSIQTEVHPIQSYISQNYASSLWELRRQALKLVNLTRCVTKSQQTTESSFQKKDKEVQMTFEKK